MMDTLRVAMAQINPTVGDFSGNSEKIIDFARRAAEMQADIVSFPELALCGYPPEDLLLKKRFINDNRAYLGRILKKIPSIICIIGFVDSDSKGNIYNAAAVIQGGSVKGTYRKHELPNYGVFDEKRYFSSGKESILFKIGSTLFAVNICEDIWRKDGIINTQSKAGASLMFNISASPYSTGKLKERKQMLVSRAKNSKCTICYNNIVGGQDELVFDGAGFIIGPTGRVIASGKQFEEDLIIADIGPAGKKSARGKQKKVNLLKQRTGEKNRLVSPVVKPLEEYAEIYSALIAGTRDYVKKNGFSKTVLGLSGGIDSALTAAIACDALGSENVIGVTMPTRYTSTETNRDAGKLAGNLGIRFIEFPIEGIFCTYLKELEGCFKGFDSGVAAENLQARIRGNILMAFSNKFGWLVLTTGNKSENSVGYCTLYGDMAGGFAIIKDVPKTLVYKLSSYRNSKGPVIPEEILVKEPTAELKPGQKDSDSLPEYSMLDPILKAYIENDRDMNYINKKGYPEDTVRKTLDLVDKSEYKRRQSPPGIKITPKSFGRDRRMPITNKYQN